MNKKILKVNPKWCKGCKICLNYCPKNVLTIKNNKIFIANEEDCIGCGICEMRCPDYAIYLEEVKEEV